jgi:hypothetical protein
MKFTAALIASAVYLAGLADAKVHRVGLKKAPKADLTIVSLSSQQADVVRNILVVQRNT